MKQNDDETTRTAKILAWRAFARSAGMITTAVLTIFYLSPWEPLMIGLLVWFVFYLLRHPVYEFFMTGRYLDVFYDLGCSIPVFLVSFWGTKWAAIIISGVIALYRGAPLIETIAVLGGLLLFDTIVMAKWGG